MGENEDDERLEEGGESLLLPQAVPGAKRKGLQHGLDVVLVFLWRFG